MKKGFLSRPTGYGTLTVLLAVVLLLALIAVNVLVSLIPEAYTILDSSYNRLYTVSNITKDLVSVLNEPVTLYFLCDDGAEDAAIRTFLDRYAGLNSHVTVKVVDPVANPTFTSNYTDATLTNYSVIVSGEKRSICIDYYELYLWENEALGIMTAEEYVTALSSTYYSYLLSTYETIQHFNGESKITNAISYVTADRIPKIYVLTGHGESALGSDFKDVLTSYGYDVSESFSLLSSGSVPSDCDVLLINAPTSDLSESESAWLSEYLAAGGKLFLTTGAGLNYTESEAKVQSQTEKDDILSGNVPDTGENALGTSDKSSDGDQTVIIKSDLPNLMALLSNYGLSATNGVIVEGNTSMYYSDYPIILLPTVNREHPVTSAASSSTMMYYVAHGILIDDSARNVTSLFETSDSSYTASTDTDSDYAKDESSVEGPFSLGVAVETDNTRIIWISSAYALDDTVDSLAGGGNHAYAASACDWLCDRGDTVVIASVSLEEPMLIVTESNVVLFAAIFCGVIPFSILIGGLAYWLRRRHS